MYKVDTKGYNSKQVQVLLYMDALLSEMDIYTFESWKLVEAYVMEALDET